MAMTAWAGSLSVAGMGTWRSGTVTGGWGLVMGAHSFVRLSDGGADAEAAVHIEDDAGDVTGGR